MKLYADCVIILFLFTKFHFNYIISNIGSITLTFLNTCTYITFYFIMKYLMFFAWRIPWTEEPGRLQSTWPQRVEYERLTHTHTKCVS